MLLDDVMPRMLLKHGIDAYLSDLWDDSGALGVIGTQPTTLDKEGVEASAKMWYYKNVRLAYN